MVKLFKNLEDTNRDGRFKVITGFLQQFGNDPTNIQILCFDRHNSHFDADSFDLLAKKYVQPFILKSGNYTNDQPNDNGTNAKLKACHNRALTEWKEQHVSVSLSRAHMNTILVTTWKNIKLDCAECIKKSFAKTKFWKIYFSSFLLLLLDRILVI